MPHPTRWQHLRCLSFAATVSMLSSTAWAISDSQFQPAFAQFVQATTGNQAMVATAAQSFSDLLKVEPGNPVLMAYAGSTQAMLASSTWFPWKKMRYAEDGLAQLDKALALLLPDHDHTVQNGTPGVLEVKFVAANTFLAVPGFMNRRERGQRLLAEVLASPLLAQAPLGFRGSVWLKAADEALKATKPDEARRWLSLAVQNQTPQKEQAAALLKGLSS